MATVILWARNLVGSSGVGSPEAILGPPDGRCTEVSGGRFVTVSQFEGGFYSGLPALLDGQIGGPPLPGYPDRATSVVTAVGRPVTAADLSRASVIAFELNGGHAAASGGWESCKWVFEDGVRPPVTVIWDERAWATRPPEVTGNGSTDGDRYSEFFRIVPPVTSGRFPALVVSYILFSLPTLDVSSPGFKVTVAGYLTGGEGAPPQSPKFSESAPDPDAIGIIACSKER